MKKSAVLTYANSLSPLGQAAFCLPFFGSLSLNRVCFFLILPVAGLPVAHATKAVWRR